LRLSVDVLDHPYVSQILHLSCFPFPTSVPPFAASNRK
jgi:hypothetical protein